eukprot:scaffold1594_cov401-Prasinococcus_capsulatus_cf.AAC.58
MSAGYGIIWPSTPAIWGGNSPRLRRLAGTPCTTGYERQALIARDVLIANTSLLWPPPSSVQGNAAMVSYYINHPFYTPGSSTMQIWGLAIMAMSELGNLWCHVLQSRLRSSSEDKSYRIPRGFLFEYITCANYTCEIWSWVRAPHVSIGLLQDAAMSGMNFYSC